ncbi:hypothetical protein Tco_1082105, partial [Tanacetum coccineum]
MVFACKKWRRFGDRCGFEKEKADWIVYVTPVGQQEYVEMCFT